MGGVPAKLGSTPTPASGWGPRGAGECPDPIAPSPASGWYPHCIVVGAHIRTDRRLSPMAGGRLLLGATPLGQPSDASARLTAALASADVVAAEDTRRLRTLATALDVAIGGKVVSFFDHVEASRVPALVDEISA